ncbi:Lrp/AsnC ligand binding domain-containing protein [Bifidobacterium bombi]|uniref:Transcriptional regulator, AsnC family n=1 Tax=Bifidobacterium bombi DSM 19703 TaxID=1341695 RepID=A0A080N3K7_9BIFI|nr:Lrp/AsnC ligand binding domain-containing protein [Bifidobacterium bombi]KFF31596.1 transcriptional regulator, AsnC family [Bifidobacterium bombi DSM 19703]
MADAVVLITTESSEINEVAETIANIEGVARVYSVAAAGIDLVVLVSTPDFNRFSDIIPGRIAKVEGVVSTQTLMAFRQYSAADDAAAFDLGAD